ncbi:hypothetical protein CAPTEDRAFT_138222, partial [Capitella teleta]
KSNSIMALIRRTYTYLDNHTFLLLYKSFARPHIDYANQVWKPHLIEIKTTSPLENVA